jgi:transcriptional regulator with XRE-family HTH domain
MREWLQKIREERKLTQEQVALLSGCSRNLYNMIERNKRTPRPELAQKIGKALLFDWTVFYTKKSNETTRNLLSCQSTHNTATVTKA